MSEKSQSVLTSLAIVKANWDSRGTTYTDMFVPFVLSGLANSGVDSEPSAVRDTISGLFRLELPDGVVASLLKHCARLDLVDSRRPSDFRALYSPNDATLGRVRSLGVQQDLLARRRRSLIDALVGAARQAHLELSRTAAEEALLAYIGRHSVPILDRLVRGVQRSDLVRVDEGLEYVVGNFIVGVLEAEPDLASYLEDVVKGSTLAAALYLAPSGVETRHFDRTVLFFDASLILKVLGHEGERIARTEREVVTLAKAARARTACFAHSVSEARGVLSRTADTLRSGRRPRAMRGVLAHYVATGATSSDLLEHASRIESDLERAGIEVRQRPEHQERWTVDEARLQAALDERVHYVYSSARDNDVDSLTAIHRLRRGQAVEQVERCRAILLTDNARLIDAAEDFFRNEEEAVVGPAILDHTMAVLLWLKQPQMAPDLPFERIVGDSYALLDPGPEVWRLYMEEIDRLSVDGEIDESRVFELRYGLEARRELMRRSGGEPKRVSVDVVRGVSERLAVVAAEKAAVDQVASESLEAVAEGREVAERLRGEAGVHEARIRMLEGQIEELRVSRVAMRDSIRKRAEREALIGIRLVLALFLVLGATAIVLPGLGLDLSPGSSAAVRWIGSIVGLLGLAGFVLEFGLRTLLDRMVAPLAHRRAWLLMRRVGLDPDGV